MLKVGDRFPSFRTQGVVTSDAATAFQEFDESSFAGQWKVLFFYPKDFTFVCPTEIAGFGRLNGDFRDRDAQVLGVSTDNEYVHLAWRQNHDDLRDLPFPLLADVSRRLSESLGILDDDEKVCQRATFIVDPTGVIRYASMNDPSVGRSPEEVLRVLEALQTGELCPCSWKPGEATLQTS